MAGLELSGLTFATHDLPNVEERWPEEGGYGKSVYAQERHSLMDVKYLESVYREDDEPRAGGHYRELEALLKE